MFDPSKPVQTRDGRKAGVYSTEGREPYPIQGWYEGEGGKREQDYWTSDGLYVAEERSGCPDYDLVNIPEPEKYKYPAMSELAAKINIAATALTDLHDYILGMD